MKSLKSTAILVGAGISRRFGRDDKVFLRIHNIPVIVYSLFPFEKSHLIDSIILVVHEDKIDLAKKIVDKYGFKKVCKIISGGLTRQESVYRGLLNINHCEIVLIHDVARPLVSAELIDKCVKYTLDYDSSLPCVPVRDTVKKGKDFVENTVSRENLFLAQTPQGFKFEIIKKVYDYALENNIQGTDDASLVEKLGFKVKMFRGCVENLKLTYPEDIPLVEKLLEQRALEIQECFVGKKE